MQIIKKIEVSYLRSLYKIEINELSSLNVFSGLNDVGKSNVLKALNLFFNGEVDWQNPFDFEGDLSFTRREEGTDSSKEAVWVAITFNNPGSYKTLPPTFRVRKQWNRWHEMSEYLDKSSWYKTDDAYGKATQKASQFIRTIDFRYVPAVKDRRYFEYLLSDVTRSYMQEQNDPALAKAVKNLNENIADTTEDIRIIFENLTGIETNIEIPTTALSILKAAGTVRAGKVPLNMRGDGIQVSYIPALLYFISKQVRKSSTHSQDNSPRKTRFIWGFEEPENSLEYGKSLALADQFRIFADEIQIFVTTHSPAFISLRGKKVSIHRVYRSQKDNKTVLNPVYHEGKEYELGLLEEEVGLLRISQEINELYISLKKNYDRVESELNAYFEDVARQNRPILYVEGENDVLTLTAAWSKCYSHAMPFQVKSCDPLLGENGGGAGTGTLQKLLEVIPKDAPNIVLGMFDYDGSGLINLNGLKNFESLENIDGKLIRKGRSGRRVGAFVIPIPTEPQDRKLYSDVQNLPLELYFSDDILQQSGVEFGYTLSIGGKGKVDCDRVDIEKLGLQPEAYLKFVSAEQKASFARRIAGRPNLQLGEQNLDLPQEEFRAFIPLFELVNQLIQELR
ncbi:MAG: AAA family ATPase [Aggregatilineales bacterium]